MTDGTHEEEMNTTGESADSIQRLVTFPFGINSQMDGHARANGLLHWSCVSPTDNSWWVRIDGMMYEPVFDLPDGYPAELRKFDNENPLMIPRWKM